MREIDLGSREVFKIKYDGKTYEVKRPSGLEVKNFTTAIQDCDKDIDKQMSASHDWLVEMGVPREILKVLDLDMYNFLLEEMAGFKKKSTNSPTE